MRQNALEDRFAGTNPVKVDGKGRVSLPAKFRRALQATDSTWGPGGSARLYVAWGNPHQDFVECLSGDAYDELDAKIQAMDEGEDDRELLEDLYYGFCEAVPVDDNGRFNLPAGAREKLDLDEEAIFKGRGKRFLIYPPAGADAVKRRIKQRLDKYNGGNPDFNPVSLTNKKKPKPEAINDETE